MKTMAIPIGYAPKFPDVCISCNAVRPTGFVRLSESFLDRRTSLNVPACERCARQLSNRHWLRASIYLAAFLAAEALSLLLLIAGIPRIAAQAVSVILLAPCLFLIHTISSRRPFPLEILEDRPQVLALLYVIPVEYGPADSRLVLKFHDDQYGSEFLKLNLPATLSLEPQAEREINATPDTEPDPALAEECFWCEETVVPVNGFCPNCNRPF